MRIAERLFAGYLVVIAVLVVLVLVLSGNRLKHELDALEVDRLSRDARLIAGEWRAGIDADAIADAAGAALGHRVTLIDSTGHVIGDSEFDGLALEQLQNHSTRPEVIAARTRGTGVSRRKSPSKGDAEFYVAVRARFGVARVSVSTAQLDAIVARGWRDLLVAGVVALAAAVIVSMFAARQLSRPIVELRDVARALAGGDLTRRPALAAGGEVGELGAAVHRMAEQLASRLTALEREEALLGAVIESLQEGVIAVDARRDVVRLNASVRRLLGLRDAPPFSADRLPRDAALRQALATALGGAAAPTSEIIVDGRTLTLTARPLGPGGAVLAVFDLTASRRLEAVRRDFVANVSHELKTPLTVIGGFAETLVTDDVPAAQRAQFAEAIRTNAERMRRIVDDLLDLSRIESGGWRPNPVSVRVADVAAEAIATTRRAGRDGRTGPEIRIAADAPSVYADPTAVQQVIANLVDNAVRYTPGVGTVTIFSTAGAGGTWVGVRDTGVGISPEHLPRIFERFYRADPARARDAGGTGLGLSIVRHLVEAHGGRVEAESERGRGTTVRAFFPDAVTDP